MSWSILGWLTAGACVVIAFGAIVAVLRSGKVRGELDRIALIHSAMETKPIATDGIHRLWTIDIDRDTRQAVCSCSWAGRDRDSLDQTDAYVLAEWRHHVRA